MDDKKYWTEYYAKNSKPTDASSFAEFVLPKLEQNKLLIELGCGNGRDSIFFAQNNLTVIGIDQIQTEIDYLNENHNEDNLKFVCDDFTDLANTTKKDIKNAHFDYVYSRFTFHSINEIKENKTLDWIEDKLNKSGLFFLEARSINDPMFKKGKNLSGSENFTNHYRRYITLDNIVQKLELRNFEIVYKIEDNNLAVYKDDNPYVIRVIGKKL